MTFILGWVTLRSAEKQLASEGLSTVFRVFLDPGMESRDRSSAPRRKNLIVSQESHFVGN